MKKILSVLTLVVTLVLGLGLTNLSAEEGIVEVFPYDSEACSLEQASCPAALVGRSNWTLTYNGFRYHFVRGSARYGHELIDTNADGVIDKTETAALTYNAFGTLWINNTAAEIVLKDGDRTGLTTVQHRIWAHFDENGVLQMLENHIHQYYIIDDNYGVEGAEADWRLATELEIDAYVAAETKPADMKYAHVRIKRVDVLDDTDGYLLEPLGYLKWTNADFVPAAGEEPQVGQPSTILSYDPNSVHIPVGWRIMTFSTHDRGAYQPALDMVLSLAGTFVDETVAPAVVAFDEVPATHTGFAALDKNPYVEGVQIVADFGEPFTLNTAGLSATWTDMFDAEGNVINKTNQKVPFDLIITDKGNVIETINFTLDGSNNYVQSGPITSVKTDVFEKVYGIQMKSTTPEGQVKVNDGVIAVGVLPNRFEGVQNHFYRDGLFIDLLSGVKAFNGNGVDITNDIVVSWEEGFNPYNPQPGKYEITLDVAYDYHWEDTAEMVRNVADTADLGFGFMIEFYNMANPEAPVLRNRNVIRYDTENPALMRWNVEFNKEASGHFTYIDYAHKDLVKTARGFGWGTTAGVVKDGVLVHTWNGFTSYTETFPDGTTKAHATALDMQNSIQAYEMAEDEYMIFGHGTPEGTPMRTWGDKVVLTGRPDIYFTAEAQVKYSITVDDRTAPQARVNNSNYRVDGSMFDSAEEAILANVSAFDNFSEVVLVVVDDGGLDLAVPGTYTVTVDAEDQAANFTTVTFDVTVVAPKLSEEEVATLLDQQAATLQAIIDQQKTTLEGIISQQKTDLQEIIDAQQAIIDAQAAALAALETSVEDDAATKAEMQAALDKANQALAAAQAAQADADANAQAIVDKSSGTPVWLTIVIALVSAGAAFGAAFVVLGKKK